MSTNWIDRLKLLFQSEKELRLCLYGMLGFYPHTITHYRMALKHRSLHEGENNERLEFLGDAILDAVVGDIVYKHFKKGGEGQLTQMRSRIVSRDTLGRIAREMGLMAIVRSRLSNESSHNSYIAGNAFEALVGAIYLDRGYDHCMRFVERKVLPMLSDMDTMAHEDINHKSRLLEWAQKRHLNVQFNIEQRRDPDPKKSSPIFVATVIMQDITLGQGQGYSKKQASQEAARLSMEMLKKPETRSLLKREKPQD